MRVVIQRASKASVEIDKHEVRETGPGLVVLLGIEDEDEQEDVEWLCRKILGMRIFSDHEDKMNLSVNDLEGDILLISQFTLHASTKKGNRPSFVKSAHPDKAEPLYQEFIKHLKVGLSGTLQTGEFGAHMDVSLVNDGPVTILMDSKNRE